MTVNTLTSQLVETISQTLIEREITFQRLADTGNDIANITVELPGEKKLKTVVLLTVSNQGVRYEAFVCRRVDENHEGVFKFLLRRNKRLYSVAYTLDNSGDIYLVGKISAAATTSEELDAIFGQILEAADGDFNTLLELGFFTSIRREWAWRESRGESLQNLEAFAHLIDDGSESK